MTENWWETEAGKLELRKMIDEQIRKFPLLNPDEVEYQFWLAGQGRLLELKDGVVQVVPSTPQGSDS